jgi:hypothetical protein
MRPGPFALEVTTTMKSALAICLLAMSGCTIFDADHPPCPSNAPPAPLPPGPPGTGDPSDPGDYGASGDRYRKLQDGTVCVCGLYEIGCHETPEGADSSMTCAFNAEGQRECEAYALPPPPDVDSMSEPVRKWSCDYVVILKEDGSRKRRNRTQQAQTYTKANWLHFKYCEKMNDNSFEYKCEDCNTTPLP